MKGKRQCHAMCKRVQPLSHFSKHRPYQCRECCAIIDAEKKAKEDLRIKREVQERMANEAKAAKTVTIKPKKAPTFSASTRRKIEDILQARKDADLQGI